MVEGGVGEYVEGAELKRHYSILERLVKILKLLDFAAIEVE